MRQLFITIFNPLLTAFVILFGIVLPVAALTIESTLHWCAGIVFDPIPGYLHPFLIASVPIANLCILIWGRSEDPLHLRRCMLGGGIACGVAVIYALMFMPLSLFAFFVVPFYGLGLLPLSPLLSLVATCSSCTRVWIARRSVGCRPIMTFLRGALTAAALFLLAETPATITRIGMQLASSTAPATAERGVRLLRTFGDPDVVRTSCFESGQRMNNLSPYALLISGPIQSGAAREIFFKAYGDDCLSRGAPSRMRPTLFPFGIPDANAAGFSNEVRLAGSRLDSTIDSGAGLAYSEWTLTVRNYSEVQKEARAQIELPHGGVVSRLTLWVNGEEREAVFGEHNQVQSAYEKVVTVRRDPALVTWVDADRISIRLFPVPPSRGEMKVRIGISSPLHLDSRERAALRLPRIIESNFMIPATLRNEIWADSHQALFGNHENLKNYENPDGSHSLRGTVPTADYEKIGGTIEIERSPAAVQAWSYDPRDPEHFVIRQTVEETTASAPKRIVFVIDGSFEMAPYIADLQDVLRHIPRKTEAAFLLAADRLELLEGFIRTENNPQLLDSIIYRLGLHNFAGGTDNISALEKAVDLAQADRADIIWLHGPQRYLLGTTDSLSQGLLRSTRAPRIISLQSAPGPDRISESLSGHPSYIQMPATFSFKKNCIGLLDTLAGQARGYVFRRERIASGTFLPGPYAVETSDHLARLWANGRVEEMVGSATNLTADAVKLATSFKLVTRVSGAVVLENDQQYRDAGLEPPAAGIVPTVPEPETYILICISALLWGYLYLNRRRFEGRLSCRA